MFEASLKVPYFLFSKTPVLLTEKKKTSSSSQEFASLKIHRHDCIIANMPPVQIPGPYVPTKGRMFATLTTGFIT